MEAAVGADSAASTSNGIVFLMRSPLASTPAKHHRGETAGANCGSAHLAEPGQLLARRLDDKVIARPLYDLAGAELVALARGEPQEGALLADLVERQLVAIPVEDGERLETILH